MNRTDRPTQAVRYEDRAAAAPLAANRYWSRPTKIQACHLDRLAVVYVRQSSPFQVAHNKESAEIQRGLRERAIEWGWPPNRVVVIDDDQAQSGTSATECIGYQWIWSEINLNHVGIILGIELDRLARSCKDCYDLMERCTLFSTLLCDFDGVYDPTVFNDRLLLGLKAIMGEAELHLIRQGFYQGRMNKARRGELFTTAPIGYVRRGDNGIELDPDPQVQGVLRLLFDKFQELGSACAVLRYLANNQIQLGLRTQHGLDAGRLRWRPASRAVILKVLRHPIYAGCYVYGLTKTDPRRRTAGRGFPRRPSRAAPVGGADPRPLASLHHLGAVPSQPGAVGGQSITSLDARRPAQRVVAFIGIGFLWPVSTPNAGGLPNRPSPAYYIAHGMPPSGPNRGANPSRADRWTN